MKTTKKVLDLKIIVWKFLNKMAGGKETPNTGDQGVDNCVNK